MTLKTARTKLRLTEIESLTQTGRARTREAANEAGSRMGDGRRPMSGLRGGRSSGWSSAKEGDAMPYRDSGSDPTIGQELRQAREAAGLEIADVAAQLRIRAEFLAALEEGRPDVLPGTTYAIGYVRTYAAFLGLDVERAVKHFKQEAAGLHQRTQLVFPSPAPEGRVPGVGLMFASVLLAGLAYGGWYWLSERGMSVYDMVPDVPERLATLIEGQTPPAAVSAPAPGVPATTSASSEPAVTPPPQTATAQTATAQSQTAPDTAPVVPDNTYTAANPTSVPVTARSTSGEAPATETTPAETRQTASAPASAITRPTTDAPAAESAPVAPVTVTEAPAPATGPAPADTAEDTPAADPEPRSTALASAAPEPTQALAATQPLATADTTGQTASPVPSAPRLSGLIGASEAAVPSAGAADRTPAAIERVVVRATGESWVQVRAQDGTTLFTRVLRNGDVYRVPDRPGLTLATGNAGALEIVVDGAPAPSLGTFGEVVRNIALDPARLAAGTAIAGRN